MSAKSSKAKKPKKPYKDPLHVPSAELIVSYKGNEVMMLNKRLLDQQNCWQNLEEIKNLHVLRLEIEAAMAAFTPDTPKDDVTSATRQWTQVQFALQSAWGFPQDPKFHRFWDIPSCKCPKMDNDDAYPSGFSVVSGSCILHSF